MSLITRCPQCATLFRVEPEQLSVAQGWVRCGQCDHVFDATLAVVSVPVLHPSKTEVTSEVPRVDLEGLLRRKDVVVDPVVAPSLNQEPLDVSGVTRLDPALGDLLQASPVGQGASEPAPAVVNARTLFSRLRHSRIPLITATLFLVLGLWFQTFVYARHELAARVPVLVPMLTALCSPLQCTLEPLRRLEGIVIDSSSFARGDSGFVLNLTLRNSSDLTLAMTSMELTLTDTQDRAVIRRVLSPSEMGAPKVLEPGKVWESALSVQPVNAVSDIAGYRLVSFYPGP
jgi:predicted Zn finger-like uncharacterized protein